VRAGLSPYQALQAATRVPAEFLGQRSEAGTVEVGKWADLVLLADNPLQDISATRRIEGVLLRGQWLPKAELSRILQGLARSD
jgi:imidazolonepropionase-like amidohydrolase